MKTITFLLLLPFLSIAQFKESKIDSVKTQYCRIRLGTESGSTMLSNKSKIFAMVDFGLGKAKEEPLEVIVDENDKKIFYSSYVQVLNVFYAKGWELFGVRESSNFGNSEFLFKRMK